MVGGTFDPLHDGHKRLLTRSFELAGPEGHVVIGLTSDSLCEPENPSNPPVRFTKTGSRAIYSFIFLVNQMGC